MSFAPSRSILLVLGPLALLLPVRAALARNLMSADGPGGTPTYELLRQAYTTELPDCGHMVPHITEDSDSELGKFVFVFHAHVNQDDDRCGGTDRQRTEIRARASDIVAQNGETVYYRWKFKLDRGFKGSNRFTHIFQIKSDLGAPIMTLTPRVSTFGITGRVSGSPNVDLARFLGVWVVVDLKVLYSDSGRVEITIRKVSDGTILYSHAGGADMWDANASGHDSKFGIYRSLEARELLRDEQVRFADFCASKANARECDDGATPVTDAAVGGGGGAGGLDAGGPPADARAGGAADGPARDAGGATGGAGGGGGATGGTGGAAGTGGRGGMGGGGSGGSGGASGSGGTTGPGGGGATGTGGASPPAGYDASPDPQQPPMTPPMLGPEAGCGCVLGTSSPPSAAWPTVMAFALAGALAARRRRRGTGRS